MNIVVLGPQGSGKSTQADLLSARINLPHVSTGAIFRELEKLPSELGQRIKSQYSTGGLISDEDTFAVLTQILSDPKNSQGLIIDGFPRNLYQAQNSPIKFDHAIYLKISDETAVKRLLNRQREDDTLEMIQERLRVYHSQTEPILNYYRGLGILIEIDGEPTQEEIFAEICQKLNLTA
jgi:adenylate kinase